MNYIRQAIYDDIERIAEILVFNYRLNFYPIFQDDSFYFEELKVSKQRDNYTNDLNNIWVYDDCVVKGFVQIEDAEVKKLFVEPALQGNSIGAELLEYAIEEKNVNFLWALEKNTKAIAFYKRHGFDVTNDRKLELRLLGRQYRQYMKFRVENVLAFRIDTNLVRCDYFIFLENGKPEFYGKYMTQYSCAEETCAILQFKGFLFLRNTFVTPALI